MYKMAEMSMKEKKEQPVDKNVSMYKVIGEGEFFNKVGKMVGRFADASYNDIQLEFQNGQVRWFQMWRVERLHL